MADSSGPAGHVHTSDPGDEPRDRDADGVSPAEEQPWKAATAKSSVLPKSPVTWAIVVLALVLAGFGYVWWSQQPERALGDHGDVVAQVDSMCLTLDITTDGLTFQGVTGVRNGWKGQQVPGTLEVTGVESWSQMTGTFTSDDGSKIPVYGGRTGKAFLSLACPISGA